MLVDILFISETKLDSSFNQAQFTYLATGLSEKTGLIEVGAF